MQHALTGFEVTTFDVEHIGMRLDGQIVLVRKQDHTINATQIVKLAHKSLGEQHNILKRLRRERGHKIRPVGKTQNTWICIQCGKELCVELGLEEKLWPLLEHVSNLQGHQSDIGIEKVCDRHSASDRHPGHKLHAFDEVNPSLTSRDAIHADWFQVKRSGAGYIEMIVDGQVVVMWEYDCSINATQILKLSQKNRSQRDYIIKTLKENNEVMFRPARGTHGLENTWVSIRRGKELCTEHGLVEKLQPLLDYGSVLQLNRSNLGSEEVCGWNPISARNGSADNHLEPRRP